MPGKLSKKNEAAWSRSKGIVHKQYPGLSEDDDKFWAIVQHIYQNMKKSRIDKTIMSEALEITLLYPDEIIKEDIIDNYYLIKSHYSNLIKAYKLQGRIDFQGLNISIENRKRSVRKWYDPLKKEKGRTKMIYPYGYIRLTEGSDGEHVDCYIGDNRESKKVYVIHQQNPNTKKYDEDKVMLGFGTADEAKEAYLKHYNDPNFFGSMDEWQIDNFIEKVHRNKGKIKGGDLVKAVKVKTHVTVADVKARGMRWVTIRGNHVLVQQLGDGSWVVVGGAGGKLSHFKIDKLLSPSAYKKRSEERTKERLIDLTKEEIREQALLRKENIKLKREARARYEESVRGIVGSTKINFKSKITQTEMDEMNEIMENEKEKRLDKKKDEKLTPEEKKEMEKVKEELEKQSEEKVVKRLEKQAIDTLAQDYFGDHLDPNERQDMKELLDTEKAEKILIARRKFRDEIKKIEAGKPDLYSKLKISDTFAENSRSIKDSIVQEIKNHVETAKNVQLYDALNAQSLAIRRHIDTGSVEALNGVVGDIYGGGAVFSNDLIKTIGLEACVRMVAAKIQSDGKGEIVKDALIRFAQKNNRRIVEQALKESRDRFNTADEIRKLTERPPNSSGPSMLAASSANGYALKQVIAGQQALGTGVGSLRAEAHLINALEESPGDSVLIDMGRNLLRARNNAKKAGLKKGEFNMRSKGGRFIMEIPKESWNKFFTHNQEIIKKETVNDRIKSHKENDGYLPPGFKKEMSLFPAQEAGLRFFKENDRVLLDFEAGIGKTPTALAACMEAIHNKGARKCIIVVPPKLRQQFYNDSKKFLDEGNFNIVDNNSRPLKARTAAYAKEGPLITIMGRDTLSRDLEAIKAGGYDMVVVDEIHDITSASKNVKGGSQRYKAMMALSDLPLKIGMSGTNIKNRKTEVYKKINFIDPGHTLGTIKEFDNKYKGLNQGTNAFQDSSNNNFREEVSQWIYTQKNNLPVKLTTKKIRVDLGDEQVRAYSQSEEVYRKERDAKVRGAAKRRDERNYQIIHDGDPKTNSKFKYIPDTLDNHIGEKAVIHTVGKAPMFSMKKALEVKYGKGSVKLIYGDSTKTQVENAKKDFNNLDSKVKFLVGTSALEAGHNLQGGTVTFHLDIPNTYASMEQREKREYRKGQDKDVTSYVVSSRSPLDMRREDIVATKKKEMAIMGNSRQIEGLDEDGFLAILNQVTKEKKKVGKKVA